MLNRVLYIYYLVLIFVSSLLVSTLTLALLSMRSTLNQYPVFNKTLVSVLQKRSGAPSVQLQFPREISLQEITRRATGEKVDNTADKPNRWPRIGDGTDGDGNGYYDYSLTCGNSSNNKPCSEYKSANDLSVIPGLLEVYFRDYIAGEPIVGFGCAKPIHNYLRIDFLKFDSTISAEYYMESVPVSKTTLGPYCDCARGESIIIFNGLEVLESGNLWYIKAGPYILRMGGSSLSGEMSDMGKSFLKKMIETYGVKMD